MQYSENTPRLAFKVHPGNGPYLLLVHGFLSSSAQWLANLKELSTVCKPVTVDLWGHGRSPAPRDKIHYSPQAYAEQFEQIRQQLGIERWFVCGYSLGAGLSIRYAHDYPLNVWRVPSKFKSGCKAHQNPRPISAARAWRPSTASLSIHAAPEICPRSSRHPCWQIAPPLNPRASPIPWSSQIPSPASVT